VNKNTLLKKRHNTIRQQLKRQADKPPREALRWLEGADKKMDVLIQDASEELSAMKRAAEEAGSAPNKKSRTTGGKRTAGEQTGPSRTKIRNMQRLVEEMRQTKSDMDAARAQERSHPEGGGASQGASQPPPPEDGPRLRGVRKDKLKTKATAKKGKLSTADAFGLDSAEAVVDRLIKLRSRREGFMESFNAGRGEAHVRAMRNTARTQRDREDAEYFAGELEALTLIRQIEADKKRRTAILQEYIRKERPAEEKTRARRVVDTVRQYFRENKFAAPAAPKAAPKAAAAAKLSDRDQARFLALQWETGTSKEEAIKEFRERVRGTHTDQQIEKIIRMAEKQSRDEQQIVPRASSAPASQLSDADQVNMLVLKRETGESKARVIKEFREEMQGRDEKWIRKILAQAEKQLKERKQLVVRGRSSSPGSGNPPNLDEGRARSRSRGGVGTSVVRTVAVGR
jgi:ribosomal protein L7/L12